MPRSCWLALLLLVTGCQRRSEPVASLDASGSPSAVTRSGASAAAPPVDAAAARDGAGPERPSVEEVFVSALVVDGAGAHWAKTDGTIHGQASDSRSARLLARLPGRVTGLGLAKSRLFATYAVDADGAGALVAIPRSGGVPTVLAALELPAAMALDETNAYVATTNDVYAITLATGEKRVFQHLEVASLAVDEASVFMAGSSSIVRVPKRGGRPSELAEGLQDSVTSLFTVGDRLYFVTEDPQGAGRSLVSLPKAGRPALPADSFYVGAGDITWSNVSSVASDGATIFWTVSSDDDEHPDVRLLRLSRGARSATEVTRRLADPTIAVFGSRVYWVSPSGLESIDKNRPGPVVVDTAAR